MEEQIPTAEAPVTTEPAPEAAPVETPSPEAAPVAQTISWQEEIEKADAKELRTHPKIAGIIGSELQRKQQEMQERLRTESETKAAQDAEAKLRRLAQEDPETFANHWLTESQKRDMQSQLDNLRGSARTELATAVGRSVNDIPEWSELTEADHAKLQESVLGKNEDEVIPAFQRTVVDLIAEKRAAKLFATWREKELPKEREAIRQEEAAKLLKTSEAPDTARSKGTPPLVDIDSMSDEQFAQYLKNTGSSLRVR